MTRLALGSLSTTAPLLARRALADGHPAGTGRPPAGPGRSGPRLLFLLSPRLRRIGSPGAPSCCTGTNVEQAARARGEDLAGRRGPPRRPAGRRTEELPPCRAASPGLRRSSPTSRVLTDGLGLPLYVCDSLGRFTFASPACLGLAGYSSLDELAAAPGAFPEPGKREAELDVIRKLGRISAFPLVLHLGLGSAPARPGFRRVHRGVHRRHVLRRDRAHAEERGAQGCAPDPGAAERQHPGGSEEPGADPGRRHPLPGPAGRVPRPGDRVPSPADAGVHPPPRHGGAPSQPVLVPHLPGLCQRHLPVQHAARHREGQHPGQHPAEARQAGSPGMGDR